jgi:hypothetical protein
MNNGEREHEVEEGTFVDEAPQTERSTEIQKREESRSITRPINVDEMLKAADKQIEFRRGLVKLIATKIDPRDVVIYGNDPAKFNVHYAKNACKQILAWIQADIVDVRIRQDTYEGKDGPYIVFECSANLVLPGGRKVNVVGSRATYDDFFGTAFQVTRPLNEVDIPSVRMAAITNMWNHALEDAGLKPTLEELKGAGLDLKKASYVQFKERGKDAAAAQGSTTTAAATAQPANGARKAPEAGTELLVSEAQAKRLFAIAKNQGWSTDDYRNALRTEFAVNRDTELPASRYKAAEQYFCDNRRD